MDVETKHASLDTLSVTIQALHVNGKQMTLAVFRQLPTGNAQDKDTHWGLVRYEIKEQGDLWLVFSRDGILYRESIEAVDMTFIMHFDNQVEHYKKQIEKMLKGQRPMSDRENLERALQASEAHLARVKQKEDGKWNRRNELEKTLPQLFIAV